MRGSDSAYILIFIIQIAGFIHANTRSAQKMVQEAAHYVYIFIYFNAALMALFNIWDVHV